MVPTKLARIVALTISINGLPEVGVKMKITQYSSGSGNCVAGIEGAKLKPIVSRSHRGSGFSGDPGRLPSTSASKMVVLTFSAVLLASVVGVASLKRRTV